MMSKIVYFIEGLFPQNIVIRYRKLKRQYGFNKKQKVYLRKLNELKNCSRPVRVVFVAIAESVWKYDSLYWLMENDPMFEPVVLICPQVNRGAEFMMKQLGDTYSSYKKKGYKVINSLNGTGAFIDIKELKPDVLMYTNPYKGLIMDKYYIDSVRNVLTCYISYYYPKGIEGYHKILENFESKLWRNFVVSELDKNRINYKDNVVVTGYPMFESFKNGSHKGKDWKQKDSKFKRIIWAPYHMLGTNDMGVQVSTFLRYSSYMLELADKYKESIQIVFKPHPLLRPALEEHNEWGKEKTDEYYEKWANGENTSFLNGEYIDLFNSSDAMIHDCGSFTIEYLYVNKPVMFLTGGDPFENIEPIGKEAIDSHYIGYSEKDIDDFINFIIGGKEDALREKRVAFFEKHLLPPNGCTAAENILNEIKKELRK